MHRLTLAALVVDSALIHMTRQQPELLESRTMQGQTALEVALERNAELRRALDEAHAAENLPEADTLQDEVLLSDRVVQTLRDELGEDSEEEEDV